MLTLLAQNLPALERPSAAQTACVSLSNQVPWHGYEAILAQAEAKNLKNVPGLQAENPAECCRTLICNCTRAVPHGSFL